MTAQRQERNGLRPRTGFRPGIALIASLAALSAAVRAPGFSGSAAQAATTERVVVNHFTGLAIEGYDPVAYFVDARPEVGLEDFEASEAGAVWRFRNEGNRAVLCRPSRYLRPPVRRLRPGRSGPRRHRGRQPPVLADLGTAALSVQPRGDPRRLRAPIPRASCTRRTRAGRRWSRIWRSSASMRRRGDASCAPPPDRPRR